MPTLHDFLVTGYFLQDINYCDQSATPPKNAQQTTALLFRFDHTAPNQDPATYKGLLIYSPPHPTGGYPSLGSFRGTGALRSGEGPPPWVRISITMRRSSVPDDDELYRYFFNGGLTFLGDVQLGLIKGPGDVQQALECDFELTRLPGGRSDVYLELKNAPQGHTGEIHYIRSTVVP